jgi:hypothetical protein
VSPLALRTSNVGKPSTLAPYSRITLDVVKLPLSVMALLEPKMMVVGSRASFSADEVSKPASTLRTRVSAKRRIVPIELRSLLCEFNKHGWERTVYRR